MIRDAPVIWLMRAGVISAFLWIAGWIAAYTRFARWWRNPIGRALVAKTALIAVLLVVTTLDLFFKLGPGASVAVTWLNVTLIWLITPAMAWRTIIWFRLHRAGLLGRDREPPPGPGKS